MKTRTPRVWHLLSNRWNSAITEYALSAAQALAGAGCPSLVGVRGGSPAERRATAHGLETVAFTKFGVRDLGRLRQVAREFRPDVIFTYGGPEAVLSRFLPQALPIVRFRGQALGARWLDRSWGFAFAHHHIAHLLAPGTSLAKQLAERSRVPVSCIPLGLDAQRFHHQPTSVRLEQGRPELLLVGRFDPVKGHRHFMQRIFAPLLATWPAERPKPRLHVLGEPANLSVAMIEAFVQAAPGLTLGEDVLITAQRVDHLPTLMNRATLGVVTSLGSEEICRVAEEFLLCGTPVFVSGVGALEDVLFAGAGESYRLGRQDEATTIVQLQRLLAAALAESSQVRATRAAAARARFSLPKMGEELLGLIAGLEARSAGNADKQPNP